MYDLVSGRQLLRSSYVVGKKKALELFPMLKKEKLCGAIIYYDGKLVYQWVSSFYCILLFFGLPIFPIFLSSAKCST